MGHFNDTFAKQQIQDEVVDRSDHPLGERLSLATDIFIQRDIAAIVQSVLDAPVQAHQVEEFSRTGIRRCQASQAVNHFVANLIGAMVTDETFPSVRH